MQKGLKKIIIVPVYILGFIIMGLLSGYLSFKILSFSKTVDVPDLKGKTLFEANDLLNKKGLLLKVEGEEYDPFIMSGRIIRQDVPSGNKVKEQRGIKVFLSKGPKVSSIPQLVGQTLEDAESIISKSGLKLGKVIRLHSNTVEKDKVIAQMPTPDEAIGSGVSQKPQDLLDKYHDLSIVVSSGPYDIIYYCPDFFGKSREEAQALAEKLRLSTEFTGSGEKVKSQKPKPNSMIKAGETIHLQL